MEKQYVHDNMGGHWLIFAEDGLFLCSCDDAELEKTLRELERVGVSI